MSTKAKFLKMSAQFLKKRKQVTQAALPAVKKKQFVLRHRAGILKFSLEPFYLSIAVLYVIQLHRKILSCYLRLKYSICLNVY